MTRLTVTAADGTTGSVDATSWHPVWLDAEGRFVDIGELKPGQRLTSADGGAPTVTDVDRYTHYEPVYDLAIDGVHTYYVVAAAPILVHNCGKRIYDAGGKHGDAPRNTSRGENSAEPADGQGALDNSVQIKPTGPRRIGRSEGETVILDRTREVPCGCTVPNGTNELYHGHVRTNIGTDPGMAAAASALRKAIKRGDIR